MSQQDFEASIKADIIVKSGIISSVSKEFSNVYINVITEIAGKVVTYIPPHVAHHVRGTQDEGRHITLNIGNAAGIIGDDGNGNLLVEGQFSGIVTTLVVPYNAIYGITIFDNAHRQQVTYSTTLSATLPYTGETVSTPTEQAPKKKPSLTVVK